MAWPGRGTPFKRAPSSGRDRTAAAQDARHHAGRYLHAPTIIPAKKPPLKFGVIMMGRSVQNKPSTFR
jgi:hypothetical protein